MRRRVGLGLVLLICLAFFVLNFWMGASAQNGQDMSTCEGCHEGIFKRLDKSQAGMVFLRHPRAPSEGLVCEACHGDTSAHMQSDGQKFDGLIRYKKGLGTPSDKKNESCLGCHQQKRSRLFWSGSSHEVRNLACADCHSVHKYGPETTGRFLLAGDSVMDTCNACHKQQVASQMRFSHHPLREGKMTCTSCHQPHGTYSERLLKGNSINETCWTCHPEFRGPFIHEHQSVRDNCANCHQPHGTNYPRLLKAPQARLCRECHLGFHHLEEEASGRLQRAVGRSCTACHVNIHGSNNAAEVGEMFLR